MSADSFRKSLLDRLRTESGDPASDGFKRLFKMVAYHRLIERLAAVQKTDWMLKGGVAMELRFGTSARFTKDLDLAFSSAVDPSEVLIATAEHPVDDFFRFEIESVRPGARLGKVSTTRYTLLSYVADIRWDKLAIDVGIGDLVPKESDLFRFPELLAFAKIRSPFVPLISVDQHVAEKLHALTNRYGGGFASSRVKDLIDLVLLLGRFPFSERKLRSMIAEVFGQRATHPLPDVVPNPPAEWRGPYARLAGMVGIATSIDVGFGEVSAFLNPVIRVRADDNRVWSPESLDWRFAPSE